MVRIAVACALALWACGEPVVAPSGPPAPPSGTPELPALPARATRAECLASVLAGGDPPSRLSETGCVLSVEPLVLAEELVPYAIASPLFSDYTDKVRWIAVPPGQTATFGAGGAPGAAGGDPLRQALRPAHRVR